MQLKKYGILLNKLGKEDLELVRYWRNSDHVRLNMEYQKMISEEMQQQWFNTLDKNKHLYFIITNEHEKIGVVNLKDINEHTLTAEAGIFVGSLGYLNTLIPILATITIMEFAFNELKLKTLKAKISASNVKAILFNESIGYKKLETQLDKDFHYYETTETLFKEATKNIRTTLDKLN